jgi:predicted dehydrogenase
MSSRPRLLVIGCGSIGERHARCFQRTERVEVVLCEINAELREAVAGRYKLRESFADFESALASAPDLAVICTPAHLHIRMAQQLASAGVPVLIEKPLSTNFDGVDHLLATCQEKNVPAAVAYVYRAFPALQQMRAAVHSGRFGRAVQLVVTAGQNFPFYRPAYRDIYYKDRATGGGAVQDALTHLINAGEWLVGSITELTADVAHQVLNGVDVEDTAHVIARHGPVLGCYSLNQHQAANEVTITVVCERGTAQMELHRQSWKWVTEPEEPWHEEPPVKLERDDAFVIQANSFLDAVEHRSAPLCSLDEAVQTLRVNLAVLGAAETRTWQRIK